MPQAASPQPSCRPTPWPGWQCGERGASELHLELEGPGEGTSLVGERATSGAHPSFCAFFTQMPTRCQAAHGSPERGKDLPKTQDWPSTWGP